MEFLGSSVGDHLIPLAILGFLVLCIVFGRKGKSGGGDK